MRRLPTYATSMIPWRCGGLSLGSPGSPGLPWALLCSSGLVWALLGSSGLTWPLRGYPGLSWAAWALLGSSGLSLGSSVSGLSCALLDSSGLSWARLGSSGLSWARLGSPGLIRALLASSGLFSKQSGYTQVRIYEVHHVILASMVAQTIMHHRRQSTNV